MDIIPFTCPECGGQVKSTSGPGRQYLYDINPDCYVELPDDFDMPTCNKCGEHYVCGDMEDGLSEIVSAVLEDKDG